MSVQLPERFAKIHIIIIGIFYLIAGSWEYLLGYTQAESIPPGIHLLLDIYRNYAMNLGRITVILGISFLFKPKFTRPLILALAWWNLFTAPAIQIWWNIYSILIKKFSTTDSWFGLWLYSFVLILILTFIRLYIINILDWDRRK